jgi:hypothetical protein
MNWSWEINRWSWKLIEHWNGWGDGGESFSLVDFLSKLIQIN